MKCQFCNCADSRVVDSRPTDDGNSIRRRRECISCGRRFTTYEKVEVQQLLVIKKDNSRELFDPKKLRGGIIAACHKRPVSAADIEKVVNSIEQVAYIRFASVYRSFTDIPTFMQELKALVGDKEDEEKE